MNQQVNNLIMNADENMGTVERTPQDEQLFRKQRLAAALRIFGRFGFDEGVAGHITVRDPLDPETFWVNPMGRSFKMMCVSDLIRVQFHKILKGGVAIKSIPATKTLLCSDYYEPISCSHSRHDYQRRK